MTRRGGFIGEAGSSSDDPAPLGSDLRPAFYALGPGRVREYVTLLHAPYTAWHLSYVVIGAALASRFSAGRLIWTVVAFFLAVGIAAHAMDELHTRPLGTAISSRILVILSGAGLAGAVAIGASGAVTVSWWLSAFVASGAFMAVAYSLELFRGRFHSDWSFALMWGGFPVVTGYFAQAGRLTMAALIAGTVAVALSLAQRALSTHVRDIRRATIRVVGFRERRDGSRIPITHEYLVATDERALRLLTAAIVLLAVTLAVTRLI